MKKLLIVLLIVFLSGCTTTKVNSGRPPLMDTTEFNELQPL